MKEKYRILIESNTKIEKPRCRGGGEKEVKWVTVREMKLMGKYFEHCVNKGIQIVTKRNIDRCVVPGYYFVPNCNLKCGIYLCATYCTSERQYCLYCDVQNQ